MHACRDVKSRGRQGIKNMTKPKNKCENCKRTVADEVNYNWECPKYKRKIEDCGSECEKLCVKCMEQKYGRQLQADEK